MVTLPPPYPYLILWFAIREGTEGVVYYTYVF